MTDALSWTDKNGDNVLVFAVAGNSNPRTQAQSRYLSAEHFVVGGKSPARQLRLVRDKVEDCDLDLTAEFVDAASAVTDIDGDGIFEVTFAYRTGCRGDISPDSLKLIVLENGQKYILRGETRVDVGDYHAGGTFEPDPSKAKWPKGLFAHAAQIWKTIVH
jgi:hypothetical protein